MGEQSLAEVQAQSTPPVLITLEKISQIASSRSNLRETSVFKEAVAEAEEQLRPLGIAGKTQLKELYILGYFDLQTAKLRGDYDPSNKLVSAAGRNFSILDAAIDSLDHSSLSWKTDLNPVINVQVDAVFTKIRDRVLKQRQLDVEVEAEIPEDIREEIEGLVEKELRKTREVIVKDPAVYLKKIEIEAGSTVVYRRPNDLSRPIQVLGQKVTVGSAIPEALREKTDKVVRETEVAEQEGEVVTIHHGLTTTGAEWRSPDENSRVARGNITSILSSGLNLLPESLIKGAEKAASYSGAGYVIELELPENSINEGSMAPDGIAYSPSKEFYPDAKGGKVKIPPQLIGRILKINRQS